jgi:hypothetical protein
MNREVKLDLYYISIMIMRPGWFNDTDNLIKSAGNASPPFPLIALDSDA